jgi:hypothetical protein
MKHTGFKKERWASGDKTICATTHRDDSGSYILFVVEHPDGTFHSFTASYNYVREKYPEN